MSENENGCLDDKNFCLDEVSKNEMFFADISLRLRNDYDVCLATVSNFGSNLRFVSRRLRDNYDVCLAAVSNCGFSFRYISQRLRDNRDICLAAVSNYGICFDLIPLRFRDDHAICLAAVSNCESSGQSEAIFKLVSHRLRDDYDICLAAVLRRGVNLVHVSPRLKHNNRICLAAIGSDGRVLRYVGGLFNKYFPLDIAPLAFKGKYFSPSFKKVITVHNKTETTISTLCMKHCKKSVYGFPEEIQEMVLTHVGSLDPGFKDRKDRVGEKRRINFIDDEFSGDLFSIATLNK